MALYADLLPAYRAFLFYSKDVTEVTVRLCWRLTSQTHSCETCYDLE